MSRDMCNDILIRNNFLLVNTTSVSDIYRDDMDNIIIVKYNDNESINNVIVAGGQIVEYYLGCFISDILKTPVYCKNSKQIIGANYGI